MSEQKKAPANMPEPKQQDKDNKLNPHFEDLTNPAVILNHIEELQETIDKEQIDQIGWRKYLIDLSKPTSPPEPLLIQSDTNDAVMFTRRNISTIAAAAKAGKTFLTSGFAAALLREEGYLGFHCPTANLKALFIDNEMDTSDTEEVARRVHRIVGLPLDQNNDRFSVLNLRENSQAERLENVEDSINELKPDIVFLDGIVDLCTDFNNIQESQALVTKLAQLATKHNCHICTCLHVNKNSQELRGHLGAFLRQKGEITLLLTKQAEEVAYIDCKPIDSRRKPIEGFSFRINSEALPELYQPVKKPPQTGKLKELFAEIFSLQNTMIHKDLCEKVKEMAKVQERAAKNKISQALDAGIIEKNNVGHYNFQKPKNSENETLPF